MSYHFITISKNPKDTNIGKDVEEISFVYF
jgi:hypothetical protein